MTTNFVFSTAKQDQYPGNIWQTKSTQSQTTTAKEDQKPACAMFG